MEKQEPERPVVWEVFPSWAQFSWLYFMSALSALRAALLHRFGVDGWEMWVIGAGILLACAIFLRHWGHYELTRDQIMVRNGYTGRVIQSILLSDIREVTIRQGFVAQFFGIGTLVIRSQIFGSNALIAGSVRSRRSENSYPGPGLETSSNGNEFRAGECMIGC